MSETETNVGKIREVVLADGETTEDYAKKIVKTKGSYKTCLEKLLSDEYDKYMLYQNVLYEIVRLRAFDGGDVFEATRTADGSIDFVLTYYNGGCCFSEAMEYALDTLAKREANK